jgi:hypothetical protein
MTVGVQYVEEAVRHEHEKWGLMLQESAFVPLVEVSPWIFLS